jgi:hypothetical protein
MKRFAVKCCDVRVLQSDRLRFSLSPGERAGVRGKEPFDLSQRPLIESIRGGNKS